MSKIVLVGCDPEVFVHKAGKAMPIIGLLGGTKDATMFIDDKGHGVLEDNCAAEFNTPPAASAEAFIESIGFCMDEINRRVASQGLSILEKVASVSFDPEQLTADAAWIFGCEPDFNAYTGVENPTPNAEDPFLRSAGGHVHVGVGALTTGEALNHCRAMDVFLGLWSLNHDTDTRRRELYGKAGAMRFKPYGFEYRTLSNFWVFDKALTREVFERTQRAVQFAKTNLIAAGGTVAELTQRAINKGDRGAAAEVWAMVPEAV